MESTMADTPKKPESSSEQLRVQGRKTALLIPWLPILIATNFVTLIFAGILSNTVTSASPDNSTAIGEVVWWLWLLILAGSVTFLGWRLWGPFFLRVGPDGIEYRHRQLRATH